MVLADAVTIEGGTFAVIAAFVVAGLPIVVQARRARNVARVAARKAALAADVAAALQATIGEKNGKGTIVEMNTRQLQMLTEALANQAEHVKSDERRFAVIDDRQLKTEAALEDLKSSAGAIRVHLGIAPDASLSTKGDPE